MEIAAAVRADLGTGPRRYAGDDAAVTRAYQTDVARVEAHARRTDDLARRILHGPWLVEAHAALAAALDGCRAGLAVVATSDALRKLLRDAEERTARSYVELVFLAREARIVAPEVVEARRRLADLAGRLGEAGMAAASAGMVETGSRTPFYREGMWGARPGMALEEGEMLAPPLPAAE
jgi:hypothetical protein